MEAEGFGWQNAAVPLLRCLALDWMICACVSVPTEPLLLPVTRVSSRGQELATVEGRSSAASRVRPWTFRSL